MVTHKAMAGAPVLKNRKGFISENERVCTFQRELRSALRKGGMVLEGSLESTDCLGEVGKLFFKGQIVNSPQRVKVCVGMVFGDHKVAVVDAHMCDKALHFCPGPCDAMDCSPSGSSVPGILQARILEWVAGPSSRGSS